VLTTKQEQYCSSSKWDFSDLRALFLNCTLKRSPERSHTTPTTRQCPPAETGAKRRNKPCRAGTGTARRSR